MGKLNRAVDIAIIVLAVCASILTVRLLLPQSHVAKPFFAPTDRVRPAPGVRTLFVVQRSGCRYCAASLPFFVRLAVSAQREGRPRIVWVATGEAPDQNLAYLRAAGIEAPTVRRLTEVGLDRIDATPVMVLVAPDGHVEREWRGQLAADAQDLALASLTGG